MADKTVPFSVYGRTYVRLSEAKRFNEHFKTIQRLNPELQFDIEVVVWIIRNHMESFVKEKSEEYAEAFKEEQQAEMLLWQSEREESYFGYQFRLCR